MVPTVNHLSLCLWPQPQTRDQAWTTRKKPLAATQSGSQPPHWIMGKPSTNTFITPEKLYATRRKHDP